MTRYRSKMANFHDRKVCILGMGYVGLTLAVAMADVGFDVLGVEIRGEIVEDLKRGKAYFHEPGLQDQLIRVMDARHLTFEADIPLNWSGSVYIITVGTPLSSEGKSRIDMIEKATKQVAKNIKNNDIVIMRSTVKLGVTRKNVKPILDAVECKYDLAFCPERTLEGKALSELRTLPQIVGGFDYEAGLRAAHIFQFLTPTVVQVSDIETAEMIKLIDNAQRDVFFAYSNEVAHACDVVGVSALEVINAGKLGYPRTNLALPGPVGGPCLEKDSHILAEGLRELGMTPRITVSARHLNENLPAIVVSQIKAFMTSLNHFPANPIITLMGIAFKGKPATDDLRGTTAKPIFNALQEAFPSAEFRGYDAVVATKDIKNFGLLPVSSLEDAFHNSNLVIILNNHAVFELMPISDLCSKMAKPGLVYDFWNNYKSEDLHLPESIGYMALGSHKKVII